MTQKKKGGGEYNETVHQLCTGFKKVYDSVRSDIFYNILIKFGIPMKLERLIRTCLNVTYSRVQASIRLSNIFPIPNGLKQRDDLL